MQARFVLSRRGTRRLLPALRSRANFSSSAGFDGFAKEIATTGPTITLRKSRFCVVAAQPSRSGSVVGSTCHRLRLGGRIVVTFAAESPLQSRSGPLASRESDDAERRMSGDSLTYGSRRAEIETLSARGVGIRSNWTGGRLRVRLRGEVMRVERALVGLLFIATAAAGGCGELAYNLPPASRMMEPGPGVGGPGPASFRRPARRTECTAAALTASAAAWVLAWAWAADVWSDGTRRARR